MRSPYSLPYLLFLPLGACFPVLDTEEPVANNNISLYMTIIPIPSWREFPRAHKDEIPVHSHTGCFSLKTLRWLGKRAVLAVGAPAKPHLPQRS